ncbi:MAG: glycosyltransferase family 4 protein [Cephaloticoccus sp.]|nr:glycosyltransferase family 4 protein [Cephaloticoccus sp.]
MPGHSHVTLRWFERPGSDDANLMHDTAFSSSQIEAPTPGTTVAPGWQIIRGWVWPKAGGHFVDVRARVEGRIFPGIHGRSRPDLAAHFGTGRQLALAEFGICLELHPGSSEITFEVLELEGRWAPFQSVTYQVEGLINHLATLPSPRPLRWHDFGRGLDYLLRWRRTRPETPWVKLAVELAAELPLAQDLMHPPEPFIGHADEPAVINSSRFGRIPMVGYLFHTTGIIQRLWATADLQALQPITLGRNTDNLAPHFPQYPQATTSGYEGYVDVPAQLPNPVTLRLYAETPDGMLHLVQVRRTRRHDAEMEKHPPVDATPENFTAALLAWESALRVRGIAVTHDAELARIVVELRAGYLHQQNLQSTPPRKPPAIILNSAARPPARIILATHNLNLEGAPLFLLDLARHLAVGGAELTVVSAEDGVLRERFAALGAVIHIVNAGPVFGATSAGAAQTALVELGRAFDFGLADLVITNTFTTFWAVHAAKLAQRHVLSYVHESTSPAAFYGRTLHPAVLGLIDEALEKADAISFTSAATRSYHARADRPLNAVLTSGWVDLRAIDQWREAHPRAGIRQKFDVKPDELLVTNIGTVCDRKGQLGFARAVDLFNRRNPELAARTRFILLGGRKSTFDDILRETLKGLNVPNLEVHPEQSDYLGYYTAADLTVCSSYEESSPRVVFEAMACGVPLLASAIPGISEIVTDEVEAMLAPPGDTTAWADALARMLNSSDLGANLSTRARGRVETHYAAEKVLPLHTALACAVAAGQFAS